MTLAALPTPQELPERAEPLLREVLGVLLRHARLRRRMTLRQLAAASTVSTAYLSEVERGHKEASSEVLAAICQALDLRILDLVSRAASVLATREQQIAAATAVSSRPVPVASPSSSDVVALAA